MVAAAADQKLESDTPCDKLITKFNATNVVRCEFVSFAAICTHSKDVYVCVILQQRLTEIILLKIPSQLQQLDQQMRRQFQDLCVSILMLCCLVVFRSFINLSTTMIENLP